MAAELRDSLIIHSIPLRYTEAEVAVTPAQARNQLLEGVTADWIYFIDDDAFVEPSFFVTFSRTILDFPQVSALGGPNLTPPRSSRFQRATGVALASRFATFFSVSRYRKEGVARETNEASLILCNLFARRSALKKPPFPGTFICNEENWLLQTLTAEKRQIIYAPDLWVFHERRESWPELSRQVYKYGYGRGQNLRRRPGTLRLAHVLPSVCVIYLVVLLIALLRIRLTSVDLLLPFSLHFFLCIACGMRATLIASESLEIGFLSMLIFPFIHFFYGLGVLNGLFKKYE